MVEFTVVRMKAGCLEHGNCILFIERSEGTNKSMTDAGWQWVEILDVNVLNSKEKNKFKEKRFKKNIMRSWGELKKKTKPVLLESRKEKEKKERIEGMQ